MTPQFLRSEAARFREMAESVEREASRQRLLGMAADYEARAKAADATQPEPAPEPQPEPHAELGADASEDSVGHSPGQAPGTAAEEPAEPEPGSPVKSRTRLRLTRTRSVS